MIADLRALWQRAFGDTDAFLDGFFAAGFSKERCHYIAENGVPVSALYWFDCGLNSQKLAYIYAVTTDENHRGKGLARRLMTETHAILKEQGYAGAILVPAGQALFGMYEKMGYRAATRVRKFAAEQGIVPAKVTQIDAGEYARLRRQYLPEKGVIQEGTALSFLQTYCEFYKGEDFLLVASDDNGALQVQELLGNADVAPGVLRALNYGNGTFRTPGNDREFAMFLPLRADCPVPGYFGLALD